MDIITLRQLKTETLDSTPGGTTFFVPEGSPSHRTLSAVILLLILLGLLVCLYVVRSYDLHLQP